MARNGALNWDMSIFASGAILKVLFCSGFLSIELVWTKLGVSMVLVSLDSWLLLVMLGRVMPV